ncbi:hypothetical protein CDAR_74861 [Caerostris darwini]|uniref:Uncharacterized protein n=1 Tax=Caerostris darwini TaxID=1538125 RepID=A0AAV4P024_9ARAC|nr:hypothetical protein CDAR_74861 [Caerostris darwini]
MVPVAHLSLTAFLIPQRHLVGNIFWLQFFSLSTPLNKEDIFLGHLSHQGVKIITTPPRSEIAIYIAKCSWTCPSTVRQTQEAVFALIVGVSMCEYITPVLTSHPVISSGFI